MKNIQFIINDQWDFVIRTTVYDKMGFSTDKYTNWRGLGDIGPTLDILCRHIRSAI